MKLLEKLAMVLKQLEAIEVFVSGKDIFVALPTGYIICALLPGVFNKLRGKWKI